MLNNRFYIYCQEAAIGECCQGKRKTAYKYVWKFNKIN